MKKKQKKGFTLIEALMVITIMFILSLITVPVMQSLHKQTDLESAVAELSNTLRLAQSMTLGSEGDSQWGVYFDSSSATHKFILFKGDKYSSRDPNFDQEFSMPENVEYQATALLGIGEIIFRKVSGTASNSGSLELVHTENPGEVKSIFIEDSGLISLAASVVSDAERVEDSRHVHIEYSREIDIVTVPESIILTFDDATTETIDIATNMVAGQLFWEGTVTTALGEQELKIHTHYLNDSGHDGHTMLCIHRDRRFNNEGFIVDISGDPAASPKLMRYWANGSTFQENSSFILSLLWQ